MKRNELQHLQLYARIARIPCWVKAGLHERLFMPYFAFCCCDAYKYNSGRNGLFDLILPQREGRQELKAGTKAVTIEHCLLACSVCFSYNTLDHRTPGVAPPMEGWVLSPQPLIKNINAHRLPYRKSDGNIFPIKVSSSHRTQVYVKLMKTNQHYIHHTYRQTYIHNRKFCADKTILIRGYLWEAV